MPEFQFQIFVEPIKDTVLARPTLRNEDAIEAAKAAVRTLGHELSDPGETPCAQGCTYSSRSFALWVSAETCCTCKVEDTLDEIDRALRALAMSLFDGSIRVSIRVASKVEEDLCYSLTTTHRAECATAM